jgi:hypothetical protein
MVHVLFLFVTDTDYAPHQNSPERDKMDVKALAQVEYEAIKMKALVALASVFIVHKKKK